MRAACSRPSASAWQASRTPPAAAGLDPASESSTRRAPEVATRTGSPHLQPGGYSPERFVTGLLPDLAAPERKVTGLHVFTFNEIEPTERWRQETLALLLAAA